MKLKTQSIIALFLLVLTMCSLTSCLLDDGYVNSKEELEVISGRNFAFFKYSEKAFIYINYGSHGNDYLGVATKNANEDKDWIDTSKKKILEGTFKKFGWNDFKLYILMDNYYYEFNIAKYKIPNNTKKYDWNRLLIKYDRKAFKKKFTNYKNYDWIKVHSH